MWLEVMWRDLWYVTRSQKLVNIKVREKVHEIKPLFSREQRLLGDIQEPRFPSTAASDAKDLRPWQGRWRTQRTQQFCQSISYSKYPEQHWWAKLIEASGSKTSARPLSPVRSLVLRFPSSSRSPTAKIVSLTLVRCSPTVFLSVSHTSCGCHPAVLI